MRIVDDNGNGTRFPVPVEECSKVRCGAVRCGAVWCGFEYERGKGG